MVHVNSSVHTLYCDLSNSNIRNYYAVRIKSDHPM